MATTDTGLNPNVTDIYDTLTALSICAPSNTCNATLSSPPKIDYAAVFNLERRLMAAAHIAVGHPADTVFFKIRPSTLGRDAGLGLFYTGPKVEKNARMPGNYTGKLYRMCQWQKIIRFTPLKNKDERKRYAIETRSHKIIDAYDTPSEIYRYTNQADNVQNVNISFVSDINDDHVEVFSTKVIDPTIANGIVELFVDYKSQIYDVPPIKGRINKQ